MILTQYRFKKTSTKKIRLDSSWSVIILTLTYQKSGVYEALETKEWDRAAVTFLFGFRIRLIVCKLQIFRQNCDIPCLTICDQSVSFVQLLSTVLKRFCPLDSRNVFLLVLTHLQGGFLTATSYVKLKAATGPVKEVLWIKKEFKDVVSLLVTSFVLA